MFVSKLHFVGLVLYVKIKPDDGKIIICLGSQSSASGKSTKRKFNTSASFNSLGSSDIFFLFYGYFIYFYLTFSFYSIVWGHLIHVNKGYFYFYFSFSFLCIISYL